MSNAFDNRMNDIYVLTDFFDLSDDIGDSLKKTQRIKYTCFDASDNFIVFGATSGSIYLFQRNPCKFLHLVPNKYGPVGMVAISQNERYIAIATVKGTICVYVINLSQGSAPQILSASIGESSVVTFLHWSSDERQFYYGDKKGEVHLVTLSFFMGRNLVNISIHPILFLDSPIVQICDFESLLLVSNYSKCILCNTEYEEFKQIGNRPRDGYYGACFAISQDETLLPSRIYCARPGTRFWEVDFEGNVLQTHQFKMALSCPPTRILKTDDTPNNEEIKPNFDNVLSDDSTKIDYAPQNLQFPKLLMINNDFILTFTDNSIYIFDPRTSSVVLWCNEFNRIADCRVINNNEIIIFTQCGSLLTLRLVVMHQYAIELVNKNKLLDCVHLLKSNLKYFAEKAKELNDLSVLNNIKNYLIKINQYEVLNDLSVIFDSILHRESEISKAKKLENGIYVLENSFCDNLKSKPLSKLNKQNEKQFKDALLTVTGKFGKNIIKYKFNIFSDEQKSYVNDLLPSQREHHNIVPFNNINQQYFGSEILPNDDDDDNIVSNRITTRKPFDHPNLLTDFIISDEEKIVRNLFIIFKSSKISNINFLDRYNVIFDKYDSREIIDLLSKLEAIMIDNGYSEIDAKCNCYEMYFNYLNTEIIWEIDDVSREFIIKGFTLVNSNSTETTTSNSTVVDMLKCDKCDFPINFNTVCKFRNIGEILLKFLWSRNEFERCFLIIKNVPSIVDVLCHFYIKENQIDKVITIIVNYGDHKLFEDAAKIFNFDSWDKCFSLYVSVLNGYFNCFNCDNIVENHSIIDKNFFYTWNRFLNVALQYIDSYDILDLVIKYSNSIPNDAIDRDFFLKCLLK